MAFLLLGTSKRTRAERLKSPGAYCTVSLMGKNGERHSIETDAISLFGALRTR